MLLKGKIGIYLEKTYFAFKIGSGQNLVSFHFSLSWTKGEVNVGELFIFNHDIAFADGITINWQ